MRGTNTYTGATTVSSGTLALSGSITSAITATAGTFAPQGSPTVSGNLAIDSGGKFRARINGTTPGNQYDQLIAAANVTLAGALELIRPPDSALETRSLSSAKPAPARFPELSAAFRKTRPFPPPRTTSGRSATPAAMATMSCSRCPR